MKTRLKPCSKTHLKITFEDQLKTCLEITLKAYLKTILRILLTLRYANVQIPSLSTLNANNFQFSTVKIPVSQSIIPPCIILNIMFGNEPKQ